MRCESPRLRGTLVVEQHRRRRCAVHKVVEKDPVVFSDQELFIGRTSASLSWLPFSSPHLDQLGRLANVDERRVEPPLVGRRAQQVGRKAHGQRLRRHLVAVLKVGDLLEVLHEALQEGKVRAGKLPDQVLDSGEALVRVGQFCDGIVNRYRGYGATATHGLR